MGLFRKKVAERRFDGRHLLKVVVFVALICLCVQLERLDDTKDEEQYFLDDEDTIGEELVIGAGKYREEHSIPFDKTGVRIKTYSSDDQKEPWVHLMVGLLIFGVLGFTIFVIQYDRYEKLVGNRHDESRATVADQLYKELHPQNHVVELQDEFSNLIRDRSDSDDAKSRDLEYDDSNNLVIKRGKRSSKSSVEESLKKSDEVPEKRKKTKRIKA